MNGRKFRTGLQVWKGRYGLSFRVTLSSTG